MATKKKQPLSAATKPKRVVDPKAVDVITSAIHEKGQSAIPDSESPPIAVARLSVDLDADLFAEMKIHCVRNRIKIKNYIEILLRSDLDLSR